MSHLQKNSIISVNISDWQVRKSQESCIALPEAIQFLLHDLEIDIGMKIRSRRLKMITVLELVYFKPVWFPNNLITTVNYKKYKEIPLPNWAHSL